MISKFTHQGDANNSKLFMFGCFFRQLLLRGGLLQTETDS